LIHSENCPKYYLLGGIHSIGLSASNIQLTRKNDDKKKKKKGHNALAVADSPHQSPALKKEQPTSTSGVWTQFLS